MQRPKLLSLALLGGCLVAGPAGAAPDIAGIKLGMTLADAAAAINATFAAENMTVLTAPSVASQPFGSAGGATILRLSLTRSAATDTSQGGAFAQDSFKLLAAGPVGDLRVVGIGRSFLGATAFDRASVLRNLARRFGRPTDSTLPGDAVTETGLGGAPVTATASLTWIGGGGHPIVCLQGALQFQDYFGNAAPGAAADFADVLRTQRAAGCSTLLQVDVSYNAIHYQAFDLALAARQLGLGGKFARVSIAPDTRGAVAAESFRY